MARLVNMWQGYNPAALQEKQMPLIVEDNLAMVMDITGLDALQETPLIRGPELEEFTKKMKLLTKDELKNAFEVSYKQMQSILNHSVPCIGCRRSVERLFYDLSNLNNHPALDPIIVTSDAELTIKDEVLQNPQRLCTLLHDHSARLSELVEQQSRNKKSHRCILHSLEMQRMRPPPSAWREVWDCMEQECLKEITFIDAETLDVTLDTYLHKHKFCSECRTKVLLASSLLTTDADPTKEKGYKSALYADIKRCSGGHVHLPLNTAYISSLIGRAQPELMGRERHAKTLEIAQEEVLTCLGICVAERLNLVYRRLREEEIIVKILAAVAVDALSRHFHLAVYIKEGITQLEIYFNEELVKLERRLKLRLKRKEKKERRSEKKRKEVEEELEEQNSKLEDALASLKIQAEHEESGCQGYDQKNDVDKACESKNKNSETCSCASSTPVKEKNSKNTSNKNNAKNQQSQSSTPNNNKKSEKGKNKKKNSKSGNNTNNSNNKATPKRDQNTNNDKSVSNAKSVKENEKSNKKKSESDLISNTTNNCSTADNKTEECKKPLPVPSNNDLIIESDTNDKEIWIEVKKRLDKSHNRNNSRSSSEHSSRDCGYSSEHNVSSSSLPCTPEGSEVACSDSCCNHEGDHCQDSKIADKLARSDSGVSLLREHGGGLTLVQMLEDFEDEENGYIPAEEVLEFKSRMCQVAEQRQELRQTLKQRFALMCSNNHKPIANIH